MSLILVRVKQISVKLVIANGTKIDHFGFIDIPLQLDNSDWYDARFYVCDMQGLPILSHDLSEKLGIVEIAKSKHISVVNDAKDCEVQSPEIDVVRDKEKLKELYPKCFDGIGHFKKKYVIEINADVIPVISPPCKYPIQLKEEICDKLKEMESLGVIARLILLLFLEKHLVSLEFV